MTSKVIIQRLGTISLVYGLCSVLATFAPVSYLTAVGQVVFAMGLTFVSARYLSAYLPPLRFWGVGLVVLGTAATTTLFMMDNVIKSWTWQSIFAQTLVLAFLSILLYKYISPVSPHEV